MDVFKLLIPEVILFLAACALLMLGGSAGTRARKIAPAVALIALLIALVAAVFASPTGQIDRTGALAVTEMSAYVKAISIGVSILFVLLAWPTSASGDSNRSIHFSTETSEYFALLLLAVAGMCVVGAANSLPTLFLGIELSSIPTYIMVTMSRPQQQAQEAGVKYFFLGAAAAAILLLGMAYLFGVTGEMRLDRIADAVRGMTVGHVPALLTLAGVLLIVGLLFKLAAAPLHFYVGDVYQGAATPVTAAISYIPKVSGTIALLKILDALGGSGGGAWQGAGMLDPKLIKLLVIVAVLTMTVGNVLALLQYNVKRVLAYSSVAHSGYILVGIASMALLAPGPRAEAMGAVAFYLLAYGIMNTAAFGVLMMLPGAAREPALSAETYDDIQGIARRRPWPALAMTLCCLSLIGVPATIGFFGKLYIVRPAIGSGDTQLLWLAVLTMINAVISAAYYLKIVATMWTLPEPEHRNHATPPSERPLPVVIAVGLSAAATLVFGIVLPLAGALYHKATTLTIALGR